MARDNWHILQEDGALTVARRVPVRFDLSVETHLQAHGRLRIGASGASGYVARPEGAAWLCPGGAGRGL